MEKDWTKEIAEAERALGIRKYVSAKDNPTCLNAQFTTKHCDNVNLSDQGFCQECNRYHWVWRAVNTGRDDFGRMCFEKKMVKTDLPISNSMFGMGMDDEVFDAGYSGMADGVDSKPADFDWDEVLDPEQES